MPLTPEAIAALPPVGCTPDEYMTACEVLQGILKRVGGFPPEIARMLVAGKFTRSQWEMFVKAARWMDNNDDLRDLPGPLSVWVRDCAAAQIVDEDNGDVPQ